MSLATVLVVLSLALVSAAGVIWATVRALRIARQMRGVRVVTCPETGRLVGVAIDVRHAVASGLVDHAPRVRLRACPRWSERGRCDERCAREASDPGSTARAMVERALIGKACVFCAKRLERVAFLDHYAALLQPDRSTIEWPEIPAEQLRESLTTCRPVCWDCHVTETFRRRYPELVTDRPWIRA